MSRYAPELVEGGFAVEVADAPLLHDGLNVADVAHVLVLRERGVIPDSAARALLGVLREAVATPWSEFGYDPAHGEVYNCRERAGCTPDGRAARPCGSRCGCGCAATWPTSSRRPPRSWLRSRRSPTRRPRP